MTIRRSLQGAACLAAIIVGGCNQRVSVVDTPLSPTPTQGPQPVSPGLQPGIASVVVQPGGVEAGDGATGMVTLTGTALTPGVNVSLSSNDEGVMVTPEIQVVEGTTFARFAVTTRRFESDHDSAATITASTVNSSASTRFERWAIGATVYLKMAGDIGDPMLGGEFRRFVPGTSTIDATCIGNEVRIFVAAPGAESWSARFKAPGHEPLEARGYAIARGIDGEHEYFGDLDISGRGRSCTTVQGEFTVTELDVRNNRINVFAATFAQRCDGSDWGLYGQVRLENMANGSAANCQR